MGDALLEICGLRAGYGKKTVLDGVNIRLEQGETAALLGCNGSGKSTLLRAALGLHPQAAGSVRIAGEDVRAISVRRRAQLCAYVPQRGRIDEGMTALEAALLGANARTPLLGRYAPKQREQAAACLAQLGLMQRMDAPMGTLSQGQRQLVLFARAMMQRPQVFLLDEPDSALDLPRRREMMLRVRALAQAGGAALLAMHDVALALEHADVVLLLHEGRIARRLCMDTADEEQISEALSLLYGPVEAVRMRGRWAVLA